MSKIHDRIQTMGTQDRLLEEVTYHFLQKLSTKSCICKQGSLQEAKKQIHEFTQNLTRRNSPGALICLPVDLVR